MKWQGRRGSENVEDHRGGSTGKNILAGGGVGTLVLAAIVWFMGGNPMQVLNMVGGQESTEMVHQSTQEENDLAQFISVVLADTEEIWSKIFAKNGLTYRHPKLVIYTGSVPSACGSASSAMGPFYCPGDEKVYIDLSFYEEMKRNYNANGDFAFAYVVAHEVGHHVQNLLGTLDKVNELRARSSEKQSNELSVRLELQADFYAGIWAHYEKKFFNVLDPDDIQEALDAASGVGDDKIQQKSQGHIVPDSFTHGTSEQRKKWFYKGYETGDMNQGDTFQSSTL